jgi:hypothetical protein
MGWVGGNGGVEWGEGKPWVGQVLPWTLREVGTNGVFRTEE